MASSLPRHFVFAEWGSVVQSAAIFSVPAFLGYWVFGAGGKEGRPMSAAKWAEGTPSVAKVSGDDDDTGFCKISRPEVFAVAWISVYLLLATYMHRPRSGSAKIRTQTNAAVMLSVLLTWSWAAVRSISKTAALVVLVATLGCLLFAMVRSPSTLLALPMVWIATAICISTS